MAWGNVYLIAHAIRFLKIGEWITIIKFRQGRDIDSDAPVKGDIKMPKMKTNRGAAKRFKKTGSGKFVFAKSCAGHIMTKKTTKRKRSLRKGHIIDSTNMKEVKQLLPNA